MKGDSKTGFLILFSLLFLSSTLTFYGMTIMLFRHFFLFVIIFIFVNISLV